MTKAAIYIRVSTDEQIEESQLPECIKYCENRGWDYEIFEEHGISAYKDAKMPKKEEIIELARKGEIQHVVVWAADRWTRKGGLELLKEINLLMSYGVQFHSIQEKFIDELNIPGEVGIHVRNFLIGILGWQAKLESEKKAERVKQSRRFQKARQEGRVGRPTIEQQKGIDIMEIIRLRDEEGLSFGQIAKKLGIGKSTAYEKYIAFKKGD